MRRWTVVPEIDWCLMESAAPPIVDQEIFDAVQRLLLQDARTLCGQSEAYRFAALMCCA